jgi:hypothetical protein
MSKLDELKKLHKILLTPKKIVGQVGTLGYRTEFLPEYAAQADGSKKLRGHWRNVTHKY